MNYIWGVCFSSSKNNKKGQKQGLTNSFYSINTSMGYFYKLWKDYCKWRIFPTTL